MTGIGGGGTALDFAGLATCPGAVDDVTAKGDNCGGGTAPLAKENVGTLGAGCVGAGGRAGPAFEVTAVGSGDVSLRAGEGVSGRGHVVDLDLRRWGDAGRRALRRLRR